VSSDPAPGWDRAWQQALAALEADVEASAAALRTGEPMPASRWEAPTDLGPLPPALRGRAVTLHARIQQVHGQAGARSRELTGELEGVDRRRDAGAAYAAAAGNDPR
jgi:hypothetical protein